jgi:hypothetical protein
MKGGLLAAWLVGEGLVIWRIVHREHRVPAPGALLGVTILFAGLAAVAEYQPAATLATLTGWGLDIAAFLRFYPQGLGTQVGDAQTAQSKTEGLAAPGGTGGPQQGNLRAYSLGG